MAEYEGSVQGVIGIVDFLMDREEAVPDDVRDKLRELTRAGQSPVVGSVEAAELIHARAGDCGPELRAIGANLAEMLARNNFHGFGESGRGLGLARVLRRKPGAKAEKDDPEPKADYLPAEEAPAEEPAGEPAGEK